MTIRPAKPTEFADAFARLYGWNASERAAAMAAVFRQISKGEVNPDRLLIAEADGMIIGAGFAQMLAGGAALLVPPRGDKREVEAALLTASLESVRGAKIVQAFVDDGDGTLGETLVRGGFAFVTSVWHMRRTDEHRHVPTTLELRTFESVDPEIFASTLMSCLEHSADCPELQRVLSRDDVLAGYRGSSPDVSRWFLAIVDRQAIGVLILGGDDLSFVGVLPEFRGRGFGAQLVSEACDRIADLSLIVDERNLPAIRLYSRLGFERQTRRGVYLFSHADSAGGSPGKAGEI